MAEHSALVLKRKKVETWHRIMSYFSSVRWLRVEESFKRSSIISLVQELMSLRETQQRKHLAVWESLAFLHSGGMDVSCFLILCLPGLQGNINGKSPSFRTRQPYLGALVLTTSDKSFNFSEPIFLVIKGNYCIQSCWEDGMRKFLC